MRKAAQKPQPREQESSEEESGSEQGDEEVYVVESIKASRFDTLAGHWRYLIKWSGYSDQEMTWEPASNLNCPDLLAAYEAEQKRREKESKASESEQPKATKSSKPTSKSLKPVSQSPAKPVKKVAKGKGRASNAVEESSEEADVSMAELDRRRSEAKKKAAKVPRTSASRSEDLVASKWEKKAAAKETNGSSSTKADAGPSKKSIASKEKEKETEKGKEKEQTKENGGSTSTNGKRSRTEPKSSSVGAGSSKTNGKGKAVQADDEISESEDEPPRKRAQSLQSQTTAAKPSSRSSAKPSSSSRSAPAQAVPPASSSKKPSPLPTPAIFPTPSTSDPLRNMQFKRNPPAISPPVRISPVADVDPLNSSTKTNTPAESSGVPPPSAPPTEDPRIRPSSHPAKSSVRFADDSASSMPAPNGGAAPRLSSGRTDNVESGEGALAMAAAKDAENRKQTLANLENRLTTSEYYQKTPIFQQKTMAAACADAVLVGHGTVLRMKGRGVAIICDSRDPMVSGEGIALGLLLMMIGARMPKQLAEVAVVCVHRRETLAPIERMYNELINMKAHHVEFLHFGDGVPVEPILVSGYLIVPALSALQQGMAVESFCLSSHQQNVRNCTVMAHPASIVLARSRLPQWQKIMHTLGTSSIPIVEKQELGLDSAFVAIDKSAYLSTGEITTPLPFINTESEIVEITRLLCRKREGDPAKWRRFIIVVDQVDAAEAEKAKDRGIELCTWVGLTELTRSSLF